jgi:hypothetical protein
MTRDDLEIMVDKLRKEFVKRQGLGGYSADAETIMFLTSTMYEMGRHMLEAMPRPRPILPKGK